MLLTRDPALSAEIPRSARDLTRDPALRSGFRQRAPASLTPARRLNFTGSISLALAALRPHNVRSGHCNCRRALRQSIYRSKPWSRDAPNSPSALSPAPCLQSTPRLGPSCQSSESAALRAVSSQCRDLRTLVLR